jgi:hypothetical protein
MTIKNSIDNLNRSALMVLLAGAMVITPVILFAQVSSANSNEESNTATVSSQQALDVSVNANGRTVVHGATVTGVSSSTITATTAWGGTTVTWTLATNGSTKFLYKGGKVATNAVVVAGDKINFEGFLAATGAFTVNANSVRDLSKEKSAILDKHTFEGKLTSSLSASTLPTSFALTIGGNSYQIKVAAGTPILGKNWASTNLGIFLAGDTVRIYGSVEAASTSIIDAVVIRNATR